jgi:hypothetical protein
LVAIYGLFADPATISRNLDSLSGLLPGGAIDIIRDQMTRIATVDDPGAFTTAWSAMQRWTQVDRGPMGENLCNENNEDILNRYDVPNPRADKPDF